MLETDAEVVAVGCPFCMTMLEDGINARKGDRDVRRAGRGRIVVGDGATLRVKLISIRIPSVHPQVVRQVMDLV